MQHVVDLEKTNDGVVPKDSPELQQALGALGEQGERRLHERRGDIRKWVDDVIRAFEQTFSANELRPDTLYIILTREFGLNAHDDRVPHPGSAGPEYNAKFPLYEGFETEVHNGIQEALTSRFPKIPVIFVFSCCTYSAVLSLRTDATGKQIRRIACRSQITIVPSHPSALLKKVDKLLLDASDKWFDLYAAPRPWEHSKDPLPMTPDNRSQAAKIDLSCFGDSRFLAFGTCADLINDGSYGGSVLVIFCGSGTPLRVVKNVDQPFLLNDIRSTEASGLWGAGYYSTHEAEGNAVKSVGDRHKEKDAVKGGEVSRQAGKLYWHSDKTKHVKDGDQDYWFT